MIRHALPQRRQILLGIFLYDAATLHCADFTARGAFQLQRALAELVRHAAGSRGQGADWARLPMADSLRAADARGADRLPGTKSPPGYSLKDPETREALAEMP